jgi:hypothetical protein
MSKRRDHVNEDFYKPQLNPRNRNIVNERVGTIEQMIVRTLTELCMARFEWKGLPDSISARYMELVLFQKGCVAYFNHESFGHLALSATPSTRLNHYGDPLGFLVVGQGNFITANLKISECEPLYSNALRRTDLDIVSVYASRLAQTDRTLEVNTMNARQTAFVTIPENMLLSMDNILTQIEEGQRVIKTRPQEFGTVQEMIQAIDMNINPDIFDKLHVLRVRWYNEALGLLGIDNTNQDKKERLVTAEVDGNADQIAATRRVNLNQRQDFTERVNKHFGTEISVDYYKPPAESPLEMDAPMSTEPVI